MNTIVLNFKKPHFCHKKHCAYASASSVFVTHYEWVDNFVIFRIDSDWWNWQNLPKKCNADIMLFISVAPFFCSERFVPAADKHDIWYGLNLIALKKEFHRPLVLKFRVVGWQWNLKKNLNPNLSFNNMF